MLIAQDILVHNSKRITNKQGWISIYANYLMKIGISNILAFIPFNNFKSHEILTFGFLYTAKKSIRFQPKNKNKRKKTMLE